ncbi:hypothetical protein BOO71_0000475 [Deinococcus marmoris]|uniref:Uncharacterized protein n=2 Tax=Deinococcus marmoris TaxID=249408 RepID=A0A1U7P4R0_9DEIO|nr:hypothetical protein BOO71_0000475 [Deinococcus marmoris]
MDDSMFELIGGWAQQRGLAVEGQALFERMGDDLPDGASR